MSIKPTITPLLALVFMIAGLGVLVLATVLWGMALCALLAVAALGRPLRPLVVRARP